MFSTDEVVESYWDYWQESYGPDNKDEKFMLTKSLESTAKQFNETGRFALFMVLEDLTVNAMHAISGLELNPKELVKEWEPKEKGIINYKTYEKNGLIYIDIGDNGCGMHPKVIENLAKSCHPNSLPEKGHTIKTKNVHGYGLNIGRKLIEGINGKIYVAGTSYRQNGLIVNMGEHHGRVTGTIMRMEFYDKR